MNLTISYVGYEIYKLRISNGNLLRYIYINETMVNKILFRCAFNDAWSIMKAPHYREILLWKTEAKIENN